MKKWIVHVILLAAGITIADGFHTAPDSLRDQLNAGCLIAIGLIVWATYAQKAIQAVGEDLKIGHYLLQIFFLGWHAYAFAVSREHGDVFQVVISMALYFIVGLVILSALVQLLHPEKYFEMSATLMVGLLIQTALFNLLNQFWDSRFTVPMQLVPSLVLLLVITIMNLPNIHGEFDDITYEQ